MARFTLALFVVVTTVACGAALGGVERATMLRASAHARAGMRASGVSPASDPPTVRPTAIPTARPQTIRVPIPTYRSPRAIAFARVGGVALVHPADDVLFVGFHQAYGPAMMNMTPSSTALRGWTLPARGRGTSRHTAADIVVDPQSVIHAPVSGIVKRAGAYLLYCQYPDGFAIISPTGHPEIEVKMLHISGVRVHPGDRVIAGKTVIARRPHKLPLRSQVDRFEHKEPVWPHVHIEIPRLVVPDARPAPASSKLPSAGCR